MIGTRWIGRKTNEAALDEVNENRTTTNAMTKRKIMLIIELLLRHNQFIIIIEDGKINGRRTRGRPHKSIFEEIFQRLGFRS